MLSHLFRPVVVLLLPAFLAAPVTAGQTDHLALDARVFAAADAVLHGTWQGTRPGPLGPTGTVGVTAIIKNSTKLPIGEKLDLARGEFSLPFPPGERFVYLKLGKNGKWQLLRADPFIRLVTFADNKRYGFKDQSGRTVIKAEYDDCYPTVASNRSATAGQQSIRATNTDSSASTACSRSGRPSTTHWDFVTVWPP